MDCHVLNAYRGYAVNHKSGVCKPAWPQYEIGKYQFTNNGPAMTLSYFIDFVYPFENVTKLLFTKQSSL